MHYPITLNFKWANKSMLETYNFDLQELFNGNEPLTFLVGAGISISPPSCLASASQIMNSIIQFSAPPDAAEDLISGASIKDLRYESIIQDFRDWIDEELKFMEYFNQAEKPNAIHNFLAKMIKKGHYVMTTNFDYLIERALGIDNPNARIVITEENFTKFGNPEKNIRDNLEVLYKIHGSLQNILTGEDTKSSIVTTIDDLGKDKGENIFSVEIFKREFFNRVCENRTLIVMGYSGGDDFDIVPVLMHMENIKRIVWIFHEDIPFESSKYFLISPKDELLGNEEKSSQIDIILQNLSDSADIEVIKIVGNTASLLLGSQFLSKSELKNEEEIRNVLDP
ncbi:MAG: SIR2 family protein, partial [Candidatus Hermodarchaeota archaeon]